jgi:hypothetical protein
MRNDCPIELANRWQSGKPEMRGLAHGDHALAVGMDRAHRLQGAYVHAGAGADGRAEPFPGSAGQALETVGVLKKAAA